MNVSKLGTRAEREKWQQLRRSQFVDPQFIAHQIAPLISYLSPDNHPAEWKANIVRAKGTGRMIVKYELNGTEAYGKAYYDTSLSSSAFMWLRHMWGGGFGSHSRQQVPEPLGYIENAGMLIMRAAEGQALSDLCVEGPLERSKEAVRAAARWLAKFHQSQLFALAAESPCERIELFNVAALMAKVASRCPERSPVLIEMIHQLGSRAPEADSPSKLTPLHGQFRPAHVFINKDQVAVIDLDKIRLSDPAKDAARFVHVLKRACLETDGNFSRAQLLADEFVAQYLALAPANLQNFSYFASLYWLKAFAKILKDSNLRADTRKSLEKRYLAEFEQSVQEFPPGVVRTPRRSPPDFSSPEHNGVWLFQPLRNVVVENVAKACHQGAELTSRQFIEGKVVPLFGKLADGECHAEVVRNTGTGRLTVHYRFDSDTGLFAKLYSDSLGLQTYKALRVLWNSDFGPHSRYRVPEPIGFIADYNLLVTRQVPGLPLAAALGGKNSAQLIGGCREAAHWLATLHRRSITFGTPDTDWQGLKLFHLTTRLIKAVAAQPGHLERVREYLERTEERTSRLKARRRFVQTHGRYHHDHVFISPEAISVIDLDRCGPSDPGKDLAEFIRVLRSTAFKRKLDMIEVDHATSAFLEEYLSQIPEAAESLSCYWATGIFHSYLSTLKKSQPKKERTWEEMLDFYLSEMDKSLGLAYDEL
jgi:aminoglycoside phosphotransferase (APT) family kinase protein